MSIRLSGKVDNTQTHGDRLGDQIGYRAEESTSSLMDFMSRFWAIDPSIDPVIDSVINLDLAKDSVIDPVIDLAKKGEHEIAYSRCIVLRSITRSMTKSVS